MKNKESFVLSRWEWLIFILSIYVVIEVVVSYMYESAIPSNIARLLITIDTVICLLFLYDFFTGLFRSKNKIRYIEIHWIDFIGSIPAIGPLRALRFLKVLRVLRSTKMIFRFVYKRSSLDLFNLTLFALTLIVAVSSFSLFYLEEGIADPDNMIGERLHGISDYVWWSIYTVIGVGYGDALPIAPEGKFIAVVLMLAGIAFVGMFIGLVVDHVIKDKEIKEQLDERQVQINRIEEKLDQLIKKKGDSDIEVDN